MNNYQNAALKILAKAAVYCMDKGCALNANAVRNAFMAEAKAEHYSDVFTACVAVELQSLGVI